MRKKIIIGILLFSLLTTIVGCGSKDSENNTVTVAKELNESDIFTDRDLEQTVDVSNATKYTVNNGENINITTEGIYVISGNAKNVSIIVNTDDESKVQLVLSDLTIENESTPCIYIKNADKVFITTTGSNSLTVSNSFTSDGNTNTDAVIFSKDDLVLNGTGTLTISSTANGITSKDDLKITGGTINVTCTSDAIEANNSIAISGGTITINSKKDGLHSEYSEDTNVGYIFISGGTINIKATDDAIHATTLVQIDGGTITTNSREGIEATFVQINDGTIKINASDDGINAGSKSKKYTVTIQINGGNLTIDMGQGDTDAIDSNGNLYINGGTINITAQSPFDYDGEGKLNGGNITVNGSKVTELTSQMMNGGQGGNRRR